MTQVELDELNHEIMEKKKWIGMEDNISRCEISFSVQII